MAWAIVVALLVIYGFSRLSSANSVVTTTQTMDGIQVSRYNGTDPNDPINAFLSFEPGGCTGTFKDNIITAWEGNSTATLPDFSGSYYVPGTVTATAGNLGSDNITWILPAIDGAGKDQFNGGPNEFNSKHLTIMKFNISSNGQVIRPLNNTAWTFVLNSFGAGGLGGEISSNDDYSGSYC